MKNALTVDQALTRILAGAEPLADCVEVGLVEAAARVLARPLAARLTQPHFDASAMDGYAVRKSDLTPGRVRLTVIGQSAAGHGFRAAVGAGQAVRIFTGAPLPAGADAILIQEDVTAEGDHIDVVDARPDPEHIRPAGGDFAAGDALIPAGRRLTTRDLTLAAAMGHARLVVRRRPVVALLATGDELVAAGETPSQDQIVCSSSYGLAALVTAAGGEPLQLGIARDTRESLASHVAKAAGADILVTTGGASVGDHDLVAPVLTAGGMALDFWKIAMRPGKPLMFGRLGDQRVLGLPGNPVSSFVCARLFLVPLLRALQGLEPVPHQPLTARAAVALAANGVRAHYMRAISGIGDDGQREVRPVANQDSSLMQPLAAADCLIVRPIGAPPVPAGTPVPILPLDD